MKEIKSVCIYPLMLHLEKGNQRGKEKGKEIEKRRSPLKKSYELNHKTIRLYLNHFWDPLFQWIMYLKKKRRKLEKDRKEKDKAKQSYLYELRKRVNMAKREKDVDDLRQKEEEGQIPESSKRRYGEK